MVGFVSLCEYVLEFFFLWWFYLVIFLKDPEPQTVLFIYGERHRKSFLLEHIASVLLSP